jgi:hypothetical protein
VSEPSVLPLRAFSFCPATAISAPMLCSRSCLATYHSLNSECTQALNKWKVRNLYVGAFAVRELHCGISGRCSDRVYPPREAAPDRCGLHRLLQRMPNTSVPGQGSAGPSADPTARPARCSADPRRTSPSVLSDVVFGRHRIRDRPTAPRSPWQNGHVERLIGSIRRECLDHIVVNSEASLCRTFKAYAR